MGDRAAFSRHIHIQVQTLTSCRQSENLLVQQDVTETLCVCMYAFFFVCTSVCLKSGGSRSRIAFVSKRTNNTCQECFSKNSPRHWARVNHCYNHLHTHRDTHLLCFFEQPCPVRETQQKKKEISSTQTFHWRILVLRCPITTSAVSNGKGAAGQTVLHTNTQTAACRQH